jgi:excisionase family DNA binding protein
MEILSVTENETAHKKMELWDYDKLNAHINIKVSILRRFVFDKKIPYIKIGKLVRFRPSDIETWIDHCGAVGDSDVEHTETCEQCFDFVKEQAKDNITTV